MGMGHVPTGTLPAQRQGDELPRRQHRRARAQPAALNSPASLARAGEDIAARFLVQHGLRIVARNHRVGRGEIDLVAADGRQKVAVEVKTRRGQADPTDAFTKDKERQVRQLAARVGIGRVDLVAVSVGTEHVEIRWVRNF